MSTEIKTGQSIDTVKENLLSPVLVDNILQLPTLKDVKALSVIDVGTGDASYSRQVINQLVQQGVRNLNNFLEDLQRSNKYSFST